MNDVKEFHKSNEIELSNALFKLISDNDLRVKFGKNGKSSSFSHFARLKLRFI